MTLLNIPPADTKPAMTALNAGAEQESKAVEAKPNLSALPAVEQDSGGQVLEFTGLDLREKAGGGAYLECSNVSTRNYPCLSPRAGRLYRTEIMYRGADDLYRFDGKTVYRKGETLWCDFGDSRDIGVHVTDTPKSFAVVNNTLTVFPDAIGISLATGVSRPLGLRVQMSGNVSIVDNKTITGSVDGFDTIQTGMQYSDKMADGEYFRIPYYDTEPTDPDAQEQYASLQGSYWQTHYQDLVGKWVIPAGNAADGYTVRWQQYRQYDDYDFPPKNGDGVRGRITAVDYDDDGGESDIIHINIIVTLVNGKIYSQLKEGDVVFVNGLFMDGEEKKDLAFRVWGVSPTSVTFAVNSLYGYTVSPDVQVTMERRIPPLDFVCANSNRLWGVSNAVENTVMDDDGNPVKFNGRAVFCSKLGDPANWFYYQGVSMDSWTAAVASEGDFTGICSWSDDVICFKEREMFRVTGASPSAYTMYSFSVPGVEKGSGGSIAIIDEVVYYKNERGIYRYSGGTPTRVSEQMMDALDGAGNAGTDGRNYFISCPGGLFAYDTWHSAWVKYDDVTDGRFAWDGSTVLILTGGNVSRIDDGPLDGIRWSVTLHPDYGTVQNGYYSYSLNTGYKYYKFIFLRGELIRHDESAAEPSVTVRAKMGDREFEVVGNHTGAGHFLLRMPVAKYREDRIQLKLTGVGDCILRDIRYVYATGSEWVQSDKGGA